MGGGRSLPCVWRTGPIFAWRLCRSCTAALSCAESALGPASWASCISLSYLEAPVQWGNAKAPCAFSLHFLHMINAQCVFIICKQQQLIATNQCRYSGQFFRQNSTSSVQERGKRPKTRHRADVPEASRCHACTSRLTMSRRCAWFLLLLGGIYTTQKPASIEQAFFSPR